MTLSRPLHRHARWASSALLAAVVGLGCGPAPGGDDPSSDAGSSAEAGSGPAWMVSYTGALSGQIEGNTSTVVRQTLSRYSVSLAAGATGGGEQKLSGSYQFASGTTTGQTTFLSFSVTLADGTECGVVAPSTAMVDADVLHDDGTSLRVEFAGDLICTGDQRITIDGEFND